MSALRRTAAAALLTVLTGACAGVQLSDAVTFTDHKDNAELLARLKRPEDTDFRARFLPFTLAIAPPRLEWVQSEDIDEPTPGKDFDSPFGPSPGGQTLTAAPIGGAESNPYAELGRRSEAGPQPGTPPEAAPDLNSEQAARRLPGDGGGYGDGEGDESEGGEAETPADAPAGEAAPEEGSTQTFLKENPLDIPYFQDVKIAERPGFNFGIRRDAYMKRVKELMEQFGIFEKVVLLNENVPPQFLAICEDADNKRADLVLTSKIVRNKVTYYGISGNWVWSTLLYASLWLPGTFITDEEFKVHYDLQIDINDVRSRSHIYSGKIQVSSTGEFSDWGRGWRPLSHYLTPGVWPTRGLYYGEESYRGIAGSGLMAQAWQSFERDLIEKLHNAFIEEIKAKNFEDKINDGVSPRALGVSIGVSDYGESARAVFERLHRQRLGLKEGEGEGEEDVYGARRFADKDAGRVAELMTRGDDAAVARFYLEELKNEAATATAVRTAIHRLSRSRRPDRIFAYINLETVLVDSSAQGVNDGLKKYLLPYDAPLGELDKELMPLRAKIDALARQYEGADETRKSELLADPIFQSFEETCAAFFEKHAISFSWIAEQFERDPSNSAEDYEYLQSKEVLLLLDTTLPGQFTDLAFAPRYRIESGARRTLGPRAPIKKPEEEKAEEGGDDKTEDKPAEKADEKAEETPEEPQEPTGPDRRNGISPAFLERLVRPGLRVLFLNEGTQDPLEDVEQGLSSFVYHFAKGALTPERVPPRLAEVNGQPVERTTLRDVLDYAAGRVATEARARNSQQRHALFGDAEGFDIVRRGQGAPADSQDPDAKDGEGSGEKSGADSGERR